VVSLLSMQETSSQGAIFSLCMLSEPPSAIAWRYLFRIHVPGMASSSTTMLYRLGFEVT